MKISVNAFIHFCIVTFCILLFVFMIYDSVFKTYITESFISSTEINVSDINNKIKYSERAGIEDRPYYYNKSWYIDNPYSFKFKYHRIVILLDTALTIKNHQIDLIDFLSLNGDITTTYVERYKKELTQMEIGRSQLEEYITLKKREILSDEMTGTKGYDKNIHNIYRKLIILSSDDQNGGRLINELQSYIYRFVPYKVPVTQQTKNTLYIISKKVNYFSRLLEEKRKLVLELESLTHEKMKKKMLIFSTYNNNWNMLNELVIDYMYKYKMFVDFNYKYQYADDGKYPTETAIKNDERAFNTFNQSNPKSVYSFIDGYSDKLRFIANAEDIKIRDGYKIIVKLYRTILQVGEGSARLESLENLVDMFQDSYTESFVQEINTDDIREFNTETQDSSDPIDTSYDTLDLQLEDSDELVENTNLDDTVDTSGIEKQLKIQERQNAIELQNISNGKDNDAIKMENQMINITQKTVQPTMSKIPSTRYVDTTDDYIYE